MTHTTLIVIVVLAIVAVIAIGAAAFEARRRATLRSRFGPEYARLVQTTGTALRAEAELEARAKRVRQYHIKPLSAEENTRFMTAWHQLQSLFVDQPSKAVAEADVLVTEVMTTRGYPMAEFDQRAEDLSVDHAAVVNHYREAHQIATRPSDVRLAPSTEDLRQAFVHYRACFEDLLGGTDPGPGARMTA
jgi:hypothetical protein